MYSKYIARKVSFVVASLFRCYLSSLFLLAFFPFHIALYLLVSILFLSCLLYFCHGMYIASTFASFLPTDMKTIWNMSSCKGIQKAYFLKNKIKNSSRNYSCIYYIFLSFPYWHYIWHYHQQQIFMHIKIV